MSLHEIVRGLTRYDQLIRGNRGMCHGVVGRLSDLMRVGRTTAVKPRSLGAARQRRHRSGDVAVTNEGESLLSDVPLTLRFAQDGALSFVVS